MKKLHAALIRASKEHRRRASSEFTKYGITDGQPRILNFLAENDGCIQKEVADSCNIEPATVTSILAGMEKSGFIYRSSNSEDRRVLNVYLTSEGKAAQTVVKRVFSDLEDKCFQGFSEEEKDQAINLLNRIYENISRENESR